MTYGERKVEKKEERFWEWKNET